MNMNHWEACLPLIMFSLLQRKTAYRLIKKGISMRSILEPDSNSEHINSESSLLKNFMQWIGQPSLFTGRTTSAAPACCFRICFKQLSFLPKVSSHEEHTKSKGFGPCSFSWRFLVLVSQKVFEHNLHGIAP